MSIGSVSGYLYSCAETSKGLVATLTVAQRETFVKVHVPDRLASHIRGALHRSVSIYGVLRRHPDTHVIEEIDARRIRPLNTATTPVRAVGIWSAVKEQGLSVDDLMQAIREDGPVLPETIPEKVAAGNRGCCRLNGKNL